MRLPTGAGRIIFFLALAGMLVTAYLIYQHFSDPGESFCNVSDFVSCDVVNKSIYSEVFGIPVSVLGFLAYAFFFILSFQKFTPGSNEVAANQSGRPKGATPLILKIGILASLGGVLFSLYLTYVEFFVLYAVCIFCITQQILIFLIFLTFLVLWLKHRKSSLLHSP